MKIRIIALVFIFALMLSGCSKGGERLVQRESPVKEVTAEEFQNEYGFGLSVPAGAECVIYEIDTENILRAFSAILSKLLFLDKEKHDSFFQYFISSHSSLLFCFLITHSDSISNEPL